MTKDLTFTFRGRKLAEKRIRSLEELLDCALPVDYRAFLLKHNGGDPNRRFFFVRQTGRTTILDSFLMVDANLVAPREDASPSSISYMHHAFGRFVPPDCLIIGIVARDNLLLLRIRGKRRGRVDLKVMGDMPLPPDIADWERDPEQCVIPIAKSFSVFLDMLTIEDTEHHVK